MIENLHPPNFSSNIASHYLQLVLAQICCNFVCYMHCIYFGGIPLKFRMFYTLNIIIPSSKYPRLSCLDNVGKSEKSVVADNRATGP